MIISEVTDAYEDRRDRSLLFAKVVDNYPQCVSRFQIGIGVKDHWKVFFGLAIRGRQGYINVETIFYVS